MHVLTVTEQSLFAEADAAYVLVVTNVYITLKLKLVGGVVVGDGVADEVCCVDSVSVGGCDVTAVVIGDTDVL